MLILGVATFLVFGIVLVLLGVHQADMAHDLGLDLAASGFLGAVLALGCSVGITAIGPLVDRLPRRPLYVAVCLLAAAALLSVDPHMSYARAVAHLALIGIGCGGYITLFNTVAVTFEGVRSPAGALATLHTSSTIGASAGPWLITWATRGAESGWCRTFYAVGGCHLALALWGAFSRFPEAQPRAAQAATSARLAWLSPEFIGLAAIAFAYVGVETGLTLFAVPWAETSGHTQAAGRAAISVFWFGLMAGRIAVVLQRRAPGARLLCACGLGGAVVVGLSLTLGLPPAIALGAAGLALGPVYPVTLALTSRRYPHAVGTASGLVAGLGAWGGFCLPWVSGAVGDLTSASGAIAVLGAGTLVLALSGFALARRAAA